VEVESATIDEIVTKFNQVTAEIEEVRTITIEVKKLFLCNIIEQTSKKSRIAIPELKKTIEVASRSDGRVDHHYLVMQAGDTFAWAKCSDVGLAKEGLLPAFAASNKEVLGAWREQFEADDTIFEVDNKSLTHRPDMWGHRGFAREIAAFLHLPFIEKSHFLASHNVLEFSKKSKKSKDNPFVIENSTKECSRFAGVYIKAIENRPSDLFIASRLIKVGVRPINAIVDLTNYLMLDWSQPVHAYDAQKIEGQKLIARRAKEEETLTILDGSELTLTVDDIVIADEKGVVGLAGVMGGLNDSISATTSSLFFESAHFDPVSVRRTAFRHGIRTESSARFEKMLDPNQVIDAVLRFIKLCEQIKLECTITGDILALGKPFEEKTLGVLHSYLESRSGVKLTTGEVVDPLTRLGFTISHALQEGGDVLYTIVIPSFRGAKDVTEQADILEEVMRYFGFNRIGQSLPSINKAPGDITSLLRLRKIKHYLVYAASMTEQMNYLYYDEPFLQEVGITCDDALSIANPVSQDHVRLATSLLPNLFKNIKQNCKNENSLRFFECGRICWSSGSKVRERRSLAGIFFHKREKQDFYEYKLYVQEVLAIAGIENVEWRKRTQKDAWAMPYRSADLYHENKKIGSAGKVVRPFLVKLDALPESDAFFFELDGDVLRDFQKKEIVYTPISKFQGVTFDLSLMIPTTLTVATLEKALKKSSQLIMRVGLIDFYDKQEWEDQRSVALRLWIGDARKTLEKADIQAVRAMVISLVEELGAQVRQ